MNNKFNNIFNFVNNEKIVINFEKLIDRQMLINDKFPNPNRKTEFINVFDNMTGQIMEEIYECKEELNKNIKNMDKQITSDYQTKESLEEFLDVFMYTGSLFCETVLYFNIDYIDFLRKNKLSTLVISDSYIINNIITNNDIGIDFIPALRRKIYDRKYHKTHSEKPENYENNLLKYMIAFTYLPKEGTKTTNGSKTSNNLNNYLLPNYLNNLNNYMQDVFFCYDHGFIRTGDERLEKIKSRINLLNEIIDNKENYIINKL